MKITPMKKETYGRLLRFGNQGSFVLWKKGDGSKVSSNISDMSLFLEPSVVGRLKEGAVFVALNLSKKVDRKDGYKGPWWNFHSEVSSNTDSRLRHALEVTPLEGSYITDLIKDYPCTDSAEVMQEIKRNPKRVENNIKVLRTELECFEEKPVVIAFGDVVYDQLVKYLKDDYRIVKIRHYSANREDKKTRINWADKDVYRKYVIQTLSGV